MKPVSYLTWNNLGLCFDIGGTWILASALVFQSDKSLLSKAGTYFNWNQHVARDACAQRADGLVGAIYLTLGFLLQIQPSLLGEHPYWMIIALLIGLSSGAIYFGWIRKVHLDRKIEQLRKDIPK